MAFCNVSSHEQEVLRLTRLDTLWPICSTREQALDRLRPAELLICNVALIHDATRRSG